MVDKPKQTNRRALYLDNLVLGSLVKAVEYVPQRTEDEK